jgi:uncharacterized protein (TIGR02391 family)
LKPGFLDNRGIPAIHQIVPDPETLLSLEIPEAAFVLLQHLASNNDGCSRARPAFLGNLFGEHSNPANGYSSTDPNAARFKEAITEHLLAAWQWLLKEGLLLPLPSNVAGWVFVGSRGHEAVSKEVFDRYRRAALLPQSILHSSISATALSAFLRGEYDIAVFASYRAVEDTVRRVCGFPNQLVGSPLMRKAFDPNTGPLRDATAVASEQQAISDVYAGAMGLFKNPTSHRLNAFDSPEQTVSLVLFANYLINLIYERASANGLAI